MVLFKKTISIENYKGIKEPISIITKKELTITNISLVLNITPEKKHVLIKSITPEKKYKYKLTPKKKLESFTNTVTLEKELNYKYKTNDIEIIQPVR